MEKMVEVERATQDELRQDLKSLFQGAIRVTLEMVLEEELKAMVGARRFERVGSRKDHRNGTYLRRLLTSLGQIDVMVPRSREGHRSPGTGASRTWRLGLWPEPSGVPRPCSVMPGCQTAGRSANG